MRPCCGDHEVCSMEEYVCFTESLSCPRKDQVRLIGQCATLRKTHFFYVKKVKGRDESVRTEGGGLEQCGCAQLNISFFMEFSSRLP